MVAGQVTPTTRCRFAVPAKGGQPSASAPGLPFKGASPVDSCVRSPIRRRWEARIGLGSLGIGRAHKTSASTAHPLGG